MVEALARPDEKESLLTFSGIYFRIGRTLRRVYESVVRNQGLAQGKCVGFCAGYYYWHDTGDEILNTDCRSLMLSIHQ